MVNLILGPADLNDIPRFLLGIVIASIVIDRFDCSCSGRPARAAWPGCLVAVAGLLG